MNARERFFSQPESVREAAWDAVSRLRALDPEKFSMELEDEIWEDLAECAENLAE